MRRLFDGALLGAGFIVVVAVVIAIAYAGDIFTVDKDGTVKFAVSDAGKITVGATESYVNLVIQNDGTTPNDKVNVTVDVLTVEGIRLENVNVAADVTFSGAGGLDTGSETIDPVDTTWYYVWVITNNDGTLRNGLLSLSPTSPTLPSGYSRKRRVGAVGSTAVAGNFLQFMQEGNRCNYLAVLDDANILTDGQSTSYAAVSCGSFVPPTAMRARLHSVLLVLHNVADSLFSLNVKKNGSAGAYGQIQIVGRIQVANIRLRLTYEGDCELDNSQRIAYKINAVPSTGGGGTMYVAGYYDRI